MSGSNPPSGGYGAAHYWQPIDASGPGGWNAGGRGLGTQVGIIVEVHDETDQSYMTPESAGRWCPWSLRFHDLKRDRPTGERDQRLSVQICADYEAKYEDARGGDAPFGQAEWHTSENRTTRLVDSRGHTALETSHRRIVDSEDERYSVALTCRGIEIDVAEAPAFDPGDLEGGELPEGIEFFEATANTEPPASAPRVSFGGVTRFAPGVSINGTTFFGAAAQEAARDALAAGGSLQDAARWASAAARGQQRPPLLDAPPGGGSGGAAGGGATRERPREDGDSTRTRPPEAEDPELITEPGGNVPLLDHPTGYVWERDSNRVGLLGTLLGIGSAAGHYWEGRDGTKIGAAPLRHDAQVTMGSERCGRIAFVVDDISQREDVGEGGRLFVGYMYADTSLANQNTNLGKETCQWRPGIEVNSRLPPATDSPPEETFWHDKPRDGDDPKDDEEETPEESADKAIGEAEEAAQDAVDGADGDEGGGDPPPRGRRRKGVRHPPSTGPGTNRGNPPRDPRDVYDPRPGGPGSSGGVVRLGGPQFPLDPVDDGEGPGSTDEEGGRDDSAPDPQLDPTPSVSNPQGQERDYGGPGEPCPNQTAGIGFNDADGTRLLRSSGGDGTITRVRGGYVQRNGHTAINSNARGQLILGGHMTMDSGIQGQGGVVVQPAGSGDGGRGAIPVGPQGGGSPGGIDVEPAPAGGVRRGAEAPGDAPGGPIPVGLPNGGKNGGVVVDPPLGGDRGISRGSGERAERAARNARARQAREARDKARQDKLDRMKEAADEAERDGKTSKAKRIRRAHDKAKKKIDKAKARRERREKYKERKRKEREERVKKIKEKRKKRKEEKEKRKKERKEKARKRKEREKREKKGKKRPVTGGYVIDTTGRTSTQILEGLDDDFDNEPDGENPTTGNRTWRGTGDKEKARRELLEDAEISEFGAWNAANYPMPPMGSRYGLEGGHLMLDDWTHLVTAQLRAFQRVIVGAFGGPSYLEGNIGVVHRNRPGNPPTGSRIGAWWTAAEGQTIVLGREHQPVELISTLEAVEGGTVVAGSGGVISVIREHTGGGTIVDDRPLILLENSRTGPRVQADGDLISTVNRRFHAGATGYVQGTSLVGGVVPGERGPGLVVGEVDEDEPGTLLTPYFHVAGGSGGGARPDDGQNEPPSGGDDPTLPPVDPDEERSRREHNRRIIGQQPRGTVIMHGGTVLGGGCIVGAGGPLVLTNPNGTQGGTISPTEDGPTEIDGDVLISGNATVTGKLDVGGSIDPTDLQLDPQASNTMPTTAYGLIVSDGSISGTVAGGVYYQRAGTPPTLVRLDAAGSSGAGIKAHPSWGALDLDRHGPCWGELGVAESTGSEHPTGTHQVQVDDVGGRRKAVHRAQQASVSGGDVWTWDVRWRIPDNFTTWATTAISLDARVDEITGGGKVTVRLRVLNPTTGAELAADERDVAAAESGYAALTLSNTDLESGGTPLHEAGDVLELQYEIEKDVNSGNVGVRFTELHVTAQ